MKNLISLTFGIALGLLTIVAGNNVLLSEGVANINRIARYRVTRITANTTYKK